MSQALTEEQAPKVQTLPGIEEGALMEAPSVGLAAASTREEMELKAGFTMAAQYPRSLALVYEDAQVSCNRPDFAERAAYSFPRGGAQISGPSVNLARELARIYRHVRTAMQIVSVDERYVHVRVMAYDMQSNVAVAAEDKFEKVIYRKNAGKVKPDERDLRELINRRAAILERNCILKVLPPDLVGSALKLCQQTLQKAAQGQLEQSSEDTLRRLEIAYRSLGVTRDKLEAYLQKPLVEVTAAELAELRQIYTSILDGHTQAKEHFPEPRPVRERPFTPADTIQYAQGKDLNRQELTAAIHSLRQKLDYEEASEEELQALEKAPLTHLRGEYDRLLAELQERAGASPAHKGEQKNA